MTEQGKCPDCGAEIIGEHGTRHDRHGWLCMTRRVAALSAENKRLRAVVREVAALTYLSCPVPEEVAQLIDKAEKLLAEKGDSDD